VGKQYRGASVQEVAANLRLDWHAVKEMDTLHMREPLAVADETRPAVIGMDEISIRKGHVYCIIVGDWELGRPIWFGGVDRSEASTSMFFAALGPERSQGIHLAVMDMRKAFRNATTAHAPASEHSNAAINEHFKCGRVVGA